jgi:hypothetical protein
MSAAAAAAVAAAAAAAVAVTGLPPSSSEQSGDISVLMAVYAVYSYLFSHCQQHMSPQQQACA